MTNDDLAGATAAIKLNGAKLKSFRCGNGQGPPEHDSREGDEHGQQHQHGPARGHSRDQKQAAKDFKPGQSGGDRIEQKRAGHHIVLPHQLEELDGIQGFIHAHVEKDDAQKPSRQNRKKVRVGGFPDGAVSISLFPIIQDPAFADAGLERQIAVRPLGYAAAIDE